jgi:hypothetical protein
MTENNTPQQDQQPKEPTKITQPPQQDTEFATETNPNPNEPNQPEQKAKVAHETKQRGGNHNPTGANQYTTGRNDDRGRKS